jgi:prevent-host-death family protein
MKISSVRAELNTLVNQVYRYETRVVIEKSGLPVAALVSADDLARLNRLDAERAEGFAVIDAMRAPFKDVPSDELEREAEKAQPEMISCSRRPSAGMPMCWSPVIKGSSRSASTAPLRSSHLSISSRA